MFVVGTTVTNSSRSVSQDYTEVCDACDMHFYVHGSDHYPLYVFCVYFYEVTLPREYIRLMTSYVLLTLRSNHYCLAICRLFLLYACVCIIAHSCSQSARTRIKLRRLHANANFGPSALLC